MMLMTEHAFARVDGFDAMHMLPMSLPDPGPNMHTMLPPTMEQSPHQDFDPRVFSP